MSLATSVIDNFSYILITIFCSYYLILNLQWYSYKLKRVIFYHHKYYLHIILLLFPELIYIADNVYFKNDLILPIFLFIYMVLFLYWYIKFAVRLKFTKRVFYFFVFVIILLYYSIVYQIKDIFLILLIAYILNTIQMKIMFLIYYLLAKRKLNKYKKLKIIAITASYGKTSIKNFLYEILKHKYRVHITPGNVNTLIGVVKDINNNINSNIDIYVVEMGARGKNDIKQLTNLVNQNYSILGEVGMQHIEYFKTLENIKFAKSKILYSPRLIKAFIHKNNTYDNDNSKYIVFGLNTEILSSDLDGITFKIIVNGRSEIFKTKILGKFQANNLIPVILLAKELGFSLTEIKTYIENIPQIPHRLEKLEVNGKIILDDSYNGNINGMIEAIKLVSSYTNRKVIITPGLVEANREMNERLAKEIDKVFDLVIITGTLNRDILHKNIKITEKIILKDKKELENIIAKNTFRSDLLLFANDAPNFI